MIALAAALLLGACHRHVAEVTLDADEAARNATAAKTLADLAAADAAARAPLPRATPPPRPVAEPTAAPVEPTADDADTGEETSNEE